MDYAPIARVILRYLVGGAFMGSTVIGDQLATDPDLVRIASAKIAVGIEVAYALAKKWGWRT